MSDLEIALRSTEIGIMQTQANFRLCFTKVNTNIFLFIANTPINASVGLSSNTKKVIPTIYCKR